MSVCICASVSSLTLGVQQFGEAQVLLGQVEGILQIVVSVRFLQFIKVNQVWSEEDKQTNKQKQKQRKVKQEPSADNTDFHKKCSF